jgi:hypothetical protein
MLAVIIPLLKAVLPAPVGPVIMEMKLPFCVRFSFIGSMKNVLAMERKLSIVFGLDASNRIFSVAAT